MHHKLRFLLDSFPNILVQYHCIHFNMVYNKELHHIVNRLHTREEYQLFFHKIVFSKRLQCQSFHRDSQVSKCSNQREKTHLNNFDNKVDHISSILAMDSPFHIFFWYVLFLCHRNLASNNQYLCSWSQLNILTNIQDQLRYILLGTEDNIKLHLYLHWKHKYLQALLHLFHKPISSMILPKLKYIKAKILWVIKWGSSFVKIK
jgi:hypothetical protein